MCLLSTYFIIYRIIIIGAGDQLPVLRLHVGRGVARAPCHLDTIPGYEICQLNFA